MSKKTGLKLGIGGALAVILIGCGAGYPSGSLYSGITLPTMMEHSGTPGHSGDKTGEACDTGILGIVSFGDASLDAAKKSSGITQVDSVELHFTNILGIYTQGCTQVHGK